jgi:N-methylhydantoinase A
VREPAANSGAIIGIDVGGTFTDLVLFDPATGDMRLAKVPTTPDNQAFGVLAALDAAGADLPATAMIVHGTTTTTNAVLERKLARTGLITTQGFRDVLELGRRTRPQAYGMTGHFTPLIPRDLRLDVPERMDAQGNILIPLDESALNAAACRLLDAGCVSVVVHFLHSYANPAHELRAAEILSALWPNPHITLGHRLLSEAREYERGVTAAVNASVQPILERYLGRLTDDLAARGFPGDVLVMNGNGGMASARTVGREAAKTVMSGPASGVIAAAVTGRAAGMPDLLTYDMGGTSTDVALIRGAEPTVSSEIELDYALPIHVPMVDVRTIGAGGGSIARVNAGGLLEIGPDSAGARPGPICYGRGGTEPTISDANLLLGRLDPGRVASVDGSVPIDRVRAAFQEKLGDLMGLTAIQAAEAVIRMANVKMAGAVRMVSLSLGADPRDFALFAFGGAGPLHASAIARELGIPRVLVPARPGITNALGCLAADLRHDFVTTLNAPLDALDMGRLADTLSAQADDGERLIRAEPVTTDRITRSFAVDMQFIGQTHLLRVPLPSPRITREALRAAFEAAYFARFRVELATIRAAVVNACTTVTGRRPPPDLTRLIDPTGRKATPAEAQMGTREVIFGGKPLITPIFWRDHLPLDATLRGPAIIQQMDTTILIEPGDTARGDPLGNIIVEVGT